MKLISKTFLKNIQKVSNCLPRRYRLPIHVQPKRRRRLGRQNIVDKVRILTRTTPPGKTTKTFKMFLRRVIEINFNISTTFK